jgi:hypothetical protein
MGGAGLLLGFFSGVFVAEVRDIQGKTAGEKPSCEGAAGKA